MAQLATTTIHGDLFIQDGGRIFCNNTQIYSNEKSYIEQHNAIESPQTEYGYSFGKINDNLLIQDEGDLNIKLKGNITMISAGESGIIFEANQINLQKPNGADGIVKIKNSISTQVENFENHNLNLKFTDGYYNFSLDNFLNLNSDTLIEKNNFLTKPDNADIFKAPYLPIEKNNNSSLEIPLQNTSELIFSSKYNNFKFKILSSQIKENFEFTIAQGAITLSHNNKAIIKTVINNDNQNIIIGNDNSTITLSGNINSSTSEKLLSNYVTKDEINKYTNFDLKETFFPSTKNYHEIMQLKPFNYYPLTALDGSKLRFKDEGWQEIYNSITSEEIKNLIRKLVVLDRLKLFNIPLTPNNLFNKINQKFYNEYKAHGGFLSKKQLEEVIKNAYKAYFATFDFNRYFY